MERFVGKNNEGDSRVTVIERWGKGFLCNSQSFFFLLFIPQYETRIT